VPVNGQKVAQTSARLKAGQQPQKKTFAGSKESSPKKNQRPIVSKGRKQAKETTSARLKVSERKEASRQNQKRAETAQKTRKPRGPDKVPNKKKGRIFAALN
jgi:hypothetical protein